MAADAPAPGFWRCLLDDLAADDISSMAAAIAYYTTLSLSPLVLLAVALLGSLYPASQEQLVGEIGALVGSAGAGVVKTIADSAAQRPGLREAAGWVGLVLLLFGASAVFAQLQVALNRIWDMENREWSGVWGFLRRRVLSIGVLLSLLFLTIVSLIVQSALSAAPYVEQGILRLAWWMASFALYAALFATLYRWLPDRRIPWLTALRGALLTAALFYVGRLLIGVYLGRSTTAGAFGPAGAVIIWLLWSYYTALTFLVSAEVLYTLAHRRGWAWWKDVHPGTPRDPVEIQAQGTPQREHADPGADANLATRLHAASYRGNDV